MILTATDAQSIADEMKAVIHQDITIMDEHGIIIASTDPSRIGREHIGAQKILREGLNFLTIAKDDPEHGVRAGINMPIVVDDSPVGVMCVTGNPEKVTMFGDIIRRMTGIMLENIRSREQRELQEQAKRMYVENWLTFEGMNTEQIRRGELFGFAVQSPYHLAVIPAVDTAGNTDEVKSGQIVREISDMLGNKNGNYCCILKGQIVLMQSEKSFCAEPVLLPRTVRAVIQRNGMTRCCGYAAQREDESIKQCFRNAQMALRVSQRSEKKLPVEYDPTSPLFLAESIPEPLLQTMEKRVFEKCTASEKNAFAELIQLYFRCGGSLNACASELFVHRNTVQYRIDSLLEKTGFDLRKPYDAMVLFFASSTVIDI